MEKIDVLDENGNKTGEVVAREDVHRLGLWHRIAYIWLVNGKGQVLLQKRSTEKKTNPNKWTTATSGHLSAGDSSIEGAVRELQEEIGLNVKEEELQYLFTVKRKDKFKYHEETILDNEIADVYLLQKDVNIKDLELQEEEVSEVKWFSYESFKKMVLDGDSNLVDASEIYEKLINLLDM